MKTNISKHITYEEATHTSTGLPNEPNDNQLIAMHYVAMKLFEPIREAYGNPITINSFFRSTKVNDAVGGADNSGHLFGNAIDIDAGRDGNKQIYDWILANRRTLMFDQIINERPDKQGRPKWIHISLRESGNRKQIFTL